MLFVKYKHNPIIVPDYRVSYERKCTFNPCAIVHRGKIFLIYRAEGDAYVSRLCLAESKDSYYFTRYKGNPIIQPSRPEEQSGCEDPRITKIENTFYLTYTAYQGFDKKRGKNKVALSLATSNDLIHWKKHGIIVDSTKAGFIYLGKEHKVFYNTKAGYIYPERVNGEYIMFVGEGAIRIARSRNLRDWKLDKSVWLAPRRGYFDSKLVEVGPPVIKLKDKILFIYNSSDNYRRYSPSYLILDGEDPTRILYRHNKRILVPEEEFELFGKVNNVIFVEGLVEYNNKYFLYYGGADKCIGMATANKNKIKKHTLSNL